LRFAFISLLFLIYSRPAKVHLNLWSSFWGPPQTTALYARFSSRGDADFQDKLLSAMRYGFGGHLEKTAK
jgi:hypothetical protein